MANAPYELTSQNEAEFYNQLQIKIDKNDYAGAAQLWANIRRDNPDPYIRAEFEKEYHDMELRGHQYQAALNASTDLAAKQAYAFAYSMERKGEFGDMSNNGFFHQWGTDIDQSFGNSDCISVRFAPKTAKRSFLGIDAFAADIERNNSGFDLFKKQMGMSQEDMEKQGITFNDNGDGTITMQISKDNKVAIYNVMKGLSKTNTKYDANQDGDPDMDDDDAIPMFQMYGTDNNGNVTETADSFFGNQNSGDASSSKNGELSEYYETDAEDAYSTKNLEKIFGLQKKAMDYYKEHSEQDRHSMQQVMLLKRYQVDANGNPMDNSKPIYNEGSDSEMAHALMGVDFINSEVYATYSGDENNLFELNNNIDIDKELHKIDTGTNRSNLSKLVHTAITSGKWSYDEAVVGDMLGGYITIPAQHLSNGDSGGTDIPEITIFVKDLFANNPANTDLANDTKVRAAREANSMMMYNYNLEVPDLTGDGMCTLSPNLDTGEYNYTNSAGKSTVISKDLAQNLLNTKFIIDDGIKDLQTAAYNKDGTPRRGFDTKSAESNLQNIIIGAISETLPDVYGNLTTSLGDLLTSKYLNKNGTLSSIPNAVFPKLAKNDIDMYNFYANAYLRYIINGSGLKDILAARDRNDYSN